MTDVPSETAEEETLAPFVAAEGSPFQVHTTYLSAGLGMSWTKKDFLIVKEQKYCIQKIHSLGFDMNLGSFESDEMFPPVRESRHRGLQ